MHMLNYKEAWNIACAMKDICLKSVPLKWTSAGYLSTNVVKTYWFANLMVNLCATFGMCVVLFTGYCNSINGMQCWLFQAVALFIVRHGCPGLPFVAHGFSQADIVGEVSNVSKFLCKIHYAIIDLHNFKIIFMLPKSSTLITLWNRPLCFIKISHSNVNLFCACEILLNWTITSLTCANYPDELNADPICMELQNHWVSLSLDYYPNCAI